MNRSSDRRSFQAEMTAWSLRLHALPDLWDEDSRDPAACCLPAQLRMWGPGRRGKRAALYFIDQTERAGAFQPPVQPLLLRERWRSADFLPPLPGLLHQAAHAGQVDGFEHEPLEDVDLFDLMQRCGPPIVRLVLAGFASLVLGCISALSAQW